MTTRDSKKILIVLTSHDDLGGIRKTGFYLSEAAHPCAGGHGVMWDFPDNARLAGIARDIYEAGGVVAAVCHGPAGLVNLTLSDGSYLVAGREVSAFTNDEESAAGLTGVVPFPLQTALEERGARHVAAANFQPHVSVAGRLVTGQNPASATGVAQQVVTVLAHPV